MAISPARTCHICNATYAITRKLLCAGSYVPSIQFCLQAENKQNLLVTSEHGWSWYRMALTMLKSVIFIEPLLETLSMGNTSIKATFLEQVYLITHNTCKKKGNMFSQNV